MTRKIVKRSAFFPPQPSAPPLITQLTFSEHKIITFNKNVIFAVINLTLQQNICCKSTRYKVIAFGTLKCDTEYIY
jgi:hypothetical protein